MAACVLAAAALLGMGLWFTDRLRAERDRAEEAGRDAAARAQSEQEPALTRSSRAGVPKRW